MQSGVKPWFQKGIKHVLELYERHALYLQKHVLSTEKNVHVSVKCNFRFRLYILKVIIILSKDVMLMLMKVFGHLYSHKILGCFVLRGISISFLRGTPWL